MEAVPAQTVATAVPAEPSTVAQCVIAPSVLDELWRSSEAEACSLSRAEFEQILLRIGMAQNFGLTAGLPLDVTPGQQAAFFTSVRIADLVLARACAGGSEPAWERFIGLYRQPLLRAAIAITRNESLGRELADGLYAELYGLTVREGGRRCPLDSYSGRGSLIGWLRTTLAQRHVDQHRRTHREQPLDEINQSAAPIASSAGQPDPKILPLLASAVEEALESHDCEERFLLASYYLDGHRLHEIAAVLGVHEATVSRKLKRATEAVRKRILRDLERRGLSRREAREALETDPRDLTPEALTPGLGGMNHTGLSAENPRRLRLKELLQSSPAKPFKEQAGR
ncbi:MAG TPA: ECF-type sigma factor [Terracidiphilus sp.]|nr:ECF-type sigma factor [Terracidiphilus sp.]